jgi:co-chaperonin GroES (HSP10)
MKKNYKMAGTLLLISKEDQEENKTASGLFLAAKHNLIWGTVLSAGPGEKEYQMNAVVGCRVLFAAMQTTELNLDGETYYIVDDKNLIMTEG